MNILLLGPQGSGKGTQARLLVEKYGFFYFESGEYLRRLAEEHSNIKEIMDSGKLVPDEEFTSYLTAYLDQENLYDDILFDGFPRTLSQYTFLKNWLTQKHVKFDLVIVIKIEESESIRRLSARRQNPDTGEIYNLITDPPPANIDLTKLIQRSDDQPDAIKKRLELYASQTIPLIETLKTEAKVIEIDGVKSIEEIRSDIEKIINDTNKN